MDILLQALDIIIETKLWPDRKPSEILRILLYVHNKGWLYTPLADRKVSAVICAYRIPNEGNLEKLPAEESGTILYVPFVISLSDNNLFNVVRETLKEFLKTNSDITQLIIEDKNNQIKRYKIGERNGENQTTTATNYADVSAA